MIRLLGTTFCTSIRNVHQPKSVMSMRFRIWFQQLSAAEGQRRDLLLDFPLVYPLPTPTSMLPLFLFLYVYISLFLFFHYYYFFIYSLSFTLFIYLSLSINRYSIATDPGVGIGLVIIAFTLTKLTISVKTVSCCHGTNQQGAKIGRSIIVFLN